MFFVLARVPGRFNEAGAVMPRKEELRDAPRPLCSGFNEAGAVMPRKHISLHGVRPAAIRFNEAGAVMPRKTARNRRVTNTHHKLQ